MTDEDAIKVCTQYEVAEQQRTGFLLKAKDFSDAVRDQMLLAQPKMKAAVDKSVGELIRFAMYLGNPSHAVFGNSPAERWDCLRRTNKVFGKRWTTLDVKYGQLKEAAPEMHDMRKDAAPSFQAFYASKQAGRLLDILEMREQFKAKGKAATGAYEIIHYFHQHSLGTALLVKSRCVKLQLLSVLAPAHTTFPGFPAWGPGDADDKSPVTNLRNHVLKHVLDADPKGKALFWKDELRLWWQELGIKLSYKNAGSMLSTATFASVKGLFGPGTQDDTLLPHDKVVAFLGTVNGAAMTKAFKDDIVARYGDAYRDKALEIGRTMQDGQVHGMVKDERLVGVSGRVGRIYVFGRLEGDKLGISSCYFAENIDKVLADRIGIWNLSTA